MTQEKSSLDLVLVSLSVVINQVHAPDSSRVSLFSFSGVITSGTCNQPITHSLSYRPLCCIESYVWPALHTVLTNNCLSSTVCNRLLTVQSMHLKENRERLMRFPLIVPPSFYSTDKLSQSDLNRHCLTSLFLSAYLFRFNKQIVCWIPF